MSECIESRTVAVLEVGDDGEPTGGVRRTGSTPPSRRVIRVRLKLLGGVPAAGNAGPRGAEGNAASASHPGVRPNVPTRPRGSRKSSDGGASVGFTSETVLPRSSSRAATARALPRASASGRAWLVTTTRRASSSTGRSGVQSAGMPPL